jgi:hypothetical protein
MLLVRLLVEETKIIQEGTHLSKQVQTFGSHGIGGVSTNSGNGFSMRLTWGSAENPSYFEDKT